MTKLLGWFVAGAMTTLLIAASSGTFRLGDEPELTSAFTYHGQLKSGGDPYSGLADIRLTLWNDAFAGVQVGRAADFESVTVEDGLFAVEPDFGPEAFNGARRWIEVAVRAPAGSGGYLTLDPRQAVNATPYALYALNGRVGPEGPQGPPGDDRWQLDPLSGELAYADGGVRINAPASPALVVDSLAGGDACVQLPPGSVSSLEIENGLPRVWTISGSAGASQGNESEIGRVTLEIPGDGWLVLIGNGNSSIVQGGASVGLWVRMNQESISFPWQGLYYNGSRSWNGSQVVPVSAGETELSLGVTGSYQGGSASVVLSAIYLGGTQ